MQDVSPAFDELSGRRVGGYVLEQHLGEGSMGVVYKARSEQIILILVRPFKARP